MWNQDFQKIQNTKIRGGYLERRREGGGGMKEGNSKVAIMYKGVIMKGRM